MIYVDSSECKFKNMVMSHMGADNTDELLNFAISLGLNPNWIQKKGEWREHFDICKSKKSLAIGKGAILLDRCHYVCLMKLMKKTLTEREFLQIKTYFEMFPCLILENKIQQLIENLCHSLYYGQSK